MIKKIYTIFIFSFLLLVYFSCVFTITVAADPGWIDVNYPSQNSEYYTGQSMYIQWDASSTGNYVKIELYSGSTLRYTISQNFSFYGSSGYTYWTIPDSISSSSSYRIKITSLTYVYESDYSDYFSISSRSITVSSPDEGDTLFPSESHTIRWSSSSISGNVKIEYIKGSSTYTIDYSESNDGSYSWRVPSSISSGSNYRIKITSLTYSTVYGYSDYFNIGERQITVISPSSGNILFMGDTLNIKWNSENAGAYVKLQLYKNSNYQTIKSSTENDGEYIYTIPSSLSYSNYYRIKVTSNYYSSVYDYSDYFSIDERYIQNVRVYEVNKSWSSLYELEPNGTYKITWSSKNAGDNVEIRLIKNDVHCSWISKDTSNSGTFFWNLSDTFVGDTSYQIEVRSKDYTGVYGLSNDLTILERKITIISPGPTDVFTKGKDLKIKWEAENIDNFVKIELYKDNEVYKTIEENVYAMDQYSWKIPDDIKADSDYQIKITSNEHSDVYAVSSGNFTIEENIISQMTSTIIVIILIITVSAIGIYMIKKKLKLNVKKETPNKIINPNPIQQKTSVSHEEYDNIWEQNKP